MLKPQIPVAKEGYPFIGFMAFITLFFAALSYHWLAWLCLALTTFVLAFFRDPERFVPVEDHVMVSPADGKVIIMERVTDNEFIQGEALKISIFMNVFNVHVNRVPMTGQVEKISYKPGKFYSADSERGALQNEYCATVITTESGRKVAFVQIAGLIARRIICWLEPGDTAVKGRRFGLIRFGSRVDLYLPLEAEPLVRIGQKVKAGETLIAYLDRPTPS